MTRQMYLKSNNFRSWRVSGEGNNGDTLDAIHLSPVGKHTNAASMADQEELPVTICTQNDIINMSLASLPGSS